MAEKRSAYVLNLKGNLEDRSRRFSRALQRMARSGRRDMGLLDRSARRLGTGLDRLGNRYTALLTGGAAAGGIRFLGNLQQRYTRLGITADLSADKVEELKKKIFETAQQPDIRVDPGEILSAVESIVEKTGDLDFARDNIRNIGLAIQAAGANGQAVGELFGEFEKAGVKSTGRVLKAIDTLNVQGKAGAFTLENLAALGPRVITAYTASIRGARDGTQVLREMGATLQVIRQGTGSAEQAATAFEGVLRTLSDPSKAKLFKQLGVQIYDPKLLKQGEQVLRPINQLMVEIYEKARGRRSILGQIFDAEGVRAFNALDVDNMAKFYNVQADGTQTMHDAARAANDLLPELQSLLTTLEKLADSGLSDELRKVTDALKSIDPDTLDRLAKGAAGVLGIGGALVLHRKLQQGGRALGGMLKGGGAVGGRARGAGGVGGFGDVQKVYVVNMGQMGKGGAGAGAAGGAGKGYGSGRGLGRRGGIGRSLARGAGAGLRIAGGAATAGGYGYAAGSLINSTLIDGTKLGDEIGAAVAHTLAFFGNDDAQAAVKQMQRAADTMQRAADKFSSADNTVHLQVDNGHVRVSGLGKPGYNGPLRGPNPYNGPLRVGAD